MKRKNIIIISVALLLLLVVTVVGIGFYPMIEGRFYNGNRITLNASLTLDGKSIDMEKCTIKCATPQNKEVVITSDNGKYGVEGGEYGKYTFTITVPKELVEGADKDINISLNYINANNWYISNSDCEINIAKDENGYKASLNVTTKYNDGNDYQYEDTKEIKDYLVDFTWGV